MQITYYGHSCCGVQIGGTHVLFDPFISPNPLAARLNVDDVPADLIICTHGHQDHVADVEAVYNRTSATLVSNYEIVEWFSAKGVQNGVGVNTGGNYSFRGLQIKCFQASHSSTMPDGAPGGDPNGYVIYTEEGNFYHAGDTALMMDMQLLKGEKLSFAFLPIGDHFTMGISDAVRAADMIGCHTIVGIHYNTFPPICIDTDQAKRTFSNAGIELLLPEIGQTIEL